MENKDIRELAEMMKKNDVTKLEYQEGTVKIKLERTASDVYFSPEKTEDTSREILQEKGPKAYTEIKSPMVGVFYESNTPGGKPFVSVGDIVEKNQTLCILEAMKLMNDLNAEYPCCIKEICVANGDIVEYDQVLFLVERCE